jgi:hypothetical protein
MGGKPANKFNYSAALNILAGVLFVIAAFHPLTGEQGVDYLYIFVGVLFAIAGIIGVVKKS